MTAEPVKAATAWKTNGDLIYGCKRLGYLKDEDRILDPTFARGTWWSVWRPTNLVTHNRDEDGSDFRKLPYEDEEFDAIAYDPPYVCVGGRETSTMKSYQQRYGMDTTPRTPEGVQEQLNDGLTEMFRLVKPRGIVLIKCQDYIWGGTLRLGTHHTLCHALSLGFEIEDRMEHVGRPRPQPPGRPQRHARRNLSTLFVLRKPKTPKVSAAALFPPEGMS